MHFFRKLLLIFFLLTVSSLTFADNNYPWSSNIWTDLNYGFYWVKANHNEIIYCPTQPMPDEQIPLTCQPRPFDKQKPTLIFIHGWEPGSTFIRWRFDFMADQFGAALAWLQKDWNVGIFYWNQFADETNFYTAEEKIWTTDFSKMRWLHFSKENNTDLIYSDFCTAEKNCANVSDLLYAAVTNALQDYVGDNIRIVGHSLGGQLAVNLAYRIGDAVKAGKLSPHLLPRQVVLLDPFYTSYYYDNLNQDADFIVKNNGVIISAYLSSVLTLQDWYRGPVSYYAVITRYYPSFCSYFDSTLGEVCAHSAAWWSYLLSFKDEPPMAYYLKNHRAFPMGHAASASSSEEDLAKMVGGHYYWLQYTGGETVDTRDDTFLRQDYNKSVIKNNLFASAVAPSKKLLSQIINIRFADLPNNKTIKLNFIFDSQEINNPLILWQSSDDTIAQAFSGGFIEIKNKGTVTITATAPNDGVTKLMRTYVLYIS